MVAHTEAACEPAVTRAILLALFVCLTAASPAQESWLSRYDLEGKPSTSAELPSIVSEASGLAVSADGRLFCHTDEEGVVYVLDAPTGKIRKRFSLGVLGISGDFEGIAVKKDTLYLVSSEGVIYQFREAPDRGRSNYVTYRTPLRAENDIEGLEYDPSTNALLLACKGKPLLRGGSLSLPKEAVTVYSFSLDTRTLDTTPRFILEGDGLPHDGKSKFRPSGLALHPRSGTFFLISADAGAVVELSARGDLLASAKLPRKVHRQPEGIAFLPDGSLVICNDGQREKKGSVAVYPLRSP